MGLGQEVIQGAGATKNFSRPIITQNRQKA
jgi:hypothetical protein